MSLGRGSQSDISACRADKKSEIDMKRTAVTGSLSNSRASASSKGGSLTTLSAISATYGCPVSEILACNPSLANALRGSPEYQPGSAIDIHDEKFSDLIHVRIPKGTKLKIPKSNPSQRRESETSSPNQDATNKEDNAAAFSPQQMGRPYRRDKSPVGTTLRTLSATYDVSVSHILAINPGLGPLIRASPEYNTLLFERRQQSHDDGLDQSALKKQEEDVLLNAPIPRGTKLKLSKPPKENMLESSEKTAGHELMATTALPESPDASASTPWNRRQTSIFQSVESPSAIEQALPENQSATDDKKENEFMQEKCRSSSQLSSLEKLPLKRQDGQSDESGSSDSSKSADLVFSPEAEDSFLPSAVKPAQQPDSRPGLNQAPVTSTQWTAAATPLTKSSETLIEKFISSQTELKNQRTHVKDRYKCAQHVSRVNNFQDHCGSNSAEMMSTSTARSTVSPPRSRAATRSPSPTEVRIGLQQDEAVASRARPPSSPVSILSSRAATKTSSLPSSRSTSVRGNKNRRSLGFTTGTASSLLKQNHKVPPRSKLMLLSKIQSSKQKISQPLRMSTPPLTSRRKRASSPSLSTMSASNTTTETPRMATPPPSTGARRTLQHYLPQPQSSSAQLSVSALMTSSIHAPSQSISFQDRANDAPVDSQSAQSSFTPFQGHSDTTAVQQKDTDITAGTPAQVFLHNYLMGMSSSDMSTTDRTQFSLDNGGAASSARQQTGKRDESRRSAQSVLLQKNSQHFISSNQVQAFDASALGVSRIAAVSSCDSYNKLIAKVTAISSFMEKSTTMHSSGDDSCDETAVETLLHQNYHKLMSDRLSNTTKSYQRAASSTAHSKTQIARMTRYMAEPKQQPFITTWNVGNGPRHCTWETAEQLQKINAPDAARSGTAVRSTANQLSINVHPLLYDAFRRRERQQKSSPREFQSKDTSPSLCRFTSPSARSSRAVSPFRDSNAHRGAGTASTAYVASVRLDTPVTTTITRREKDGEVPIKRATFVPSRYCSSGNASSASHYIDSRRTPCSSDAFNERASSAKISNNGPTLTQKEKQNRMRELQWQKLF